MTDDVAALVLRDNYFQTQALSVGARRQGVALLDQQARFIRFLEKAGQLNRAIEFLPTDDEIAERKARGTRPDQPRAGGAAGLQQDVAVRRADGLRPARGPVDRHARWRATSRRCCARSSAPTSRATRSSARSSPRTCSTAWSTASARPSCTASSKRTGATAGAGRARLPGQRARCSATCRCGSRSRRSTTR